ncbi:MAG: adenylate/guanylate cyclase domain-containing protein [Pseudomonadota bacterium]
MPEFERKLTTILAADVVAFSDMMGRDETGTLRSLKQCRDLIETCIGDHHGRVFGGAGDSLIAEFGSPVTAVQCAGDFQGQIADLNRGLPAQQRMWFRVGINLGDVMIDGENLYGDGVNIAARLEQEGEPGGICISHKVHNEVHRNLAMSFADGGMRTLKNIDQPVGVFHVRPLDQDPDVRPPGREREAGRPVSGRGKRLNTSDPTLIVRDFKVAGADDAVFLADGLRDGLINSLSRHAAIDVIRHEPQGELAVDFALEASVRGQGNRVRIIFNLIELATNSQVWSERYDRLIEDALDIEEEIARAVAAAVRVKLKIVIFQRLRDTDNDELSVPELLDKAAGYFASGPGHDGSAEAALHIAVGRDPDNSMAAAMLALAMLRGFEYSPLALTAETIDEIGEHAERAVSLNAESYFAHLVAGMALQDLHGDFERALRHAQAALELNPELLGAHGLVGTATCHLGDPAAGVSILKRTMEISREDPHRFRHMRELSIAHFMSGDIETATDLMGQLVESEPRMDRNRPVQAAFLWLRGDADEATAAARRLSAAYPEFSLSTMRPIHFGQPDIADRFDKALRALGLNEARETGEA